MSDELCEAARWGNLNKVKKLLQDEKNVVGDALRAALWCVDSEDDYGVESDHLPNPNPYKTVELLLLHGADVHAHDGEALAWASRRDLTEVVRLLLSYGADVHAENDRALFWASLCGYVGVVELLLSHGADVHAENDRALIWASKNGRIDVVKLLLSHGANVHAENDKIGVVALLLSHGADVHAENDRVLEQASGQFGNEDVVKLLLSYRTEYMRAPK
jgi:ankyrin repeat protein